LIDSDGRSAATAPQHSATARRLAANAGSVMLTAELTRLNTDLLQLRNVEQEKGTDTDSKDYNSFDVKTHSEYV